MSTENRDRVRRALREFRKYEGDGSGGTGALPIGDPASGPHNPPKSLLREALEPVALGLDQVTASVSAAAVSAAASASSASASASSASASAQSATEAEAAKEGAETAAQAAGAAIYDDTTAGLAATVDGDIFLVPGTNTLVVYRNDSGVATELTTFGGFTQSGAGAVTRTVDAKLKETKSVLDFGAVGDCTGVGLGNDDSAGIQLALNWLAGGDWRKLTFPGGYRFRLASGVSASFGGRIGCAIHMDSPITPDATVARGVSIIDTTLFNLTGNVVGGGTLADYSIPDPVGGTVAFYLRGNRFPDIHIRARTYLGRVLHIAPQEDGEQKSSGAKVFIDTGDIGTGLGYDRCGQALFVDGSGLSGGGSGATGSFSGRTFWDRYGPLFLNLRDLHLPFFEGSYRNMGFEVQGCQQVYIGTIYIGDTPLSGEPAVPQIAFRPSVGADARACNRINFEKLMVLNAGVGVYMEELSEALPNGGGKILANNCGIVLHTHNCRNMKIEVQPYNSGTAWKDTGDRSDRMDVTVFGRLFSDNVVDIEGASGRRFTIRGAIENGASEKTLVKVASTGANVRLVDLDLESAAGTLLDIPSTNLVSWRGGRAVAAGGIPISTNRPRVVKDVSGLRTRNSGTATILSGNTSVTVNHGLAYTPNAPRVTGRDAETSGAFVPTGITSTTFFIQVPSAVTADRTIFWEAESEGLFSA
jgi:hypothetical protein